MLVQILQITSISFNLLDIFINAPVDPIASQIEDNNDQRLLDPKEEASISTGLSIGESLIAHVR